MIKLIKDIILIGAVAIVMFIVGYGVARGSEVVERLREGEQDNGKSD